MKKVLSLFLSFAIAVTFMPVMAFAESSVWIPLSYDGDFSLEVKSDNVSCQNDATSGILNVYQEGNISFEVKSTNEKISLDCVTVYSGELTNGVLGNVDYSTNEGSFVADSSGTATVTLNLVKNKAYTICFSEIIPISYSGDLSLEVKSDTACKNDTTRCILDVYQEGNISFEIKSTNENIVLDCVTVYSGNLADSYENINFSTNEGKFDADDTGKITVTLSLVKDKAYKIEYSEDETSSIQIKDSDNVLKATYQDLQSAINAAAAGETIGIVSNSISVEKPIEIVGKSVSIINEDGVSVEAAEAFTGDSIFIVKGGGSLTADELYFDGKNKVKYAIEAAGENDRCVLEMANATFKNFTDYAISASAADVYLQYIYTDGSNGKGGVKLTSNSQVTQLCLYENEIKETTALAYDESFKKYRPDKDWDLIIADFEPEHSSGKNTWIQGEDGVYTEKYNAPSIPAGGGGGVALPMPSDNITNSGTAGTDSAITNASVDTKTSANGTVTASVDSKTGDKIVDKAVENKSKEVIINAQTSKSNSESTTVAVSNDTLKQIKEKTEADVTIKTDTADITMDQKTIETISENASGNTVEILVEKTKDEETEMHFELRIVSNGKAISNFDGGNVSVTIKLNDTLKSEANIKLVCVYIDDNGKYSKMEGKRNSDGTYTFQTGHFSSYALMSEEDADAAIEKQNAENNARIKSGVEKTSISITKATRGKGWIKIKWKKSKGFKLDYYEVFRKAGKNGKYGKTAFFTTKKNSTSVSYKNSKSLKKGVRYYYKVRGVRIVDGQKVYTEWSDVASKVAK